MSGQVQETNDFSIASKYSMVHRGYFVDDFMQYLSPKLKRRSPLINIGYYVRAIVVNEGIKLFMSIEPQLECQILSLGAGFDTTFFRLVHGHEDIRYFEVDLRDVVEKKISFIKNNANVLNKLFSPQEISLGLTSKYYSIISQDMNDTEELQSVLTSIGFDVLKPTLFFSECAITYMPEELSTKIINWASRLQDVMFMVYEQISPNDGFGRVMMNHFTTIESPLKSVEKYRTKEDQINRYKSCGFSNSCSVGAFELYSRILPLEQHKRVLNLEPFDEWEEWHLTSCHYSLSVGTKGLFNKTSEFFSSFSPLSDVTQYDSTFGWDSLIESELKLYAHSAMLIWNSESVLIIGGFGMSNDSRHKRLEQLRVLNLETMKIMKITPPTIDGITWDCLYHSCSLLSDSQNETTFLLYGGRTSPMNHVNNPGFVISIRREEGANVQISGGKVLLKKTYPEARRRHCALNVNVGVFMCGGLSAEKGAFLKVLGDAWLFTFDEQWVKLDSKMPPRFSHSAVHHLGNVFITGGLDQKFEPIKDLWSFSVSGNVWTYYDLNILPRYGHTSHYLDDLIIIIGGVNYLSEKQPGICIINLKDKTFKEFKLSESKETSPIMLHNHSSIVSSELSSICVIGGGGNCFSFGTSFNEYLILFKCDMILQKR